MRLATIGTAHGNRAVRCDGDELLELGFDDVGAFLAAGSPQPSADGIRHRQEDASFATLVSDPSKVICVGQNYIGHIEELGRELPSYPTLFPKFADTLIGAQDDIAKPAESDALDWETELAVVIGSTVRRADPDEAGAAIAGFTVLNDISVRDWQYRTTEWTQGKVWDSTTPVGPYLVTPDEVGGVRPSLRLKTRVNGDIVQDDDTGTLRFDPVFLVRYISTIITLRPGDLIATGTPAGVGHARDPQMYLSVGDTVLAEIEGIGQCRNTIVAPSAADARTRR
jgi:acylpyruvate hydrolase